MRIIVQPTTFFGTTLKLNTVLSFNRYLQPSKFYALDLSRKIYNNGPSNRARSDLPKNRIRLDEHDVQTKFSASPENDDSEMAMEREYAKVMRSQYGLKCIQSYNPETILLVHPRVRKGGRYVESAGYGLELKLEECVALCQTIPGFRVIKSIVIPADDNTEKKMIWGSGRLQVLKAYLQNQGVTALMIDVEVLSPLQQAELTSYFGVSIYDRYTIVLCIFKLYARTREAHLQIALAEIPYIRQRLKFMDSYRHKVTPESLHVAESVQAFHGGSNQNQYEILRLREHSIRKKIKAAIDLKSASVAQKKDRLGIVKPSLVGIIGYTNAGKTSLIKKLTDSKTLLGENRLFATLDTTLHQATLPSRIRILLADTIGFIANLPIQLFASFSATLRHIENADLLIHVHDLSHPNVIYQRNNVLTTLQQLNISENLIEGMINVGNKIDRVTAEQRESLMNEGIISSSKEEISQHTKSISISCRTGEGLQELIKDIDMRVQQISGSRPRRLRLPLNSDTITYLYNEGIVASSPHPTDCGNFLIFDVVMTDAQMAQLQANTGKKLKLSRSLTTQDA